MTEEIEAIAKRLVVGHKRDGRSIYDAQARSDLVRASRQPGVSLAKIARMCGINANGLSNWVRHSGAPRRGTTGSIATNRWRADSSYQHGERRAMAPRQGQCQDTERFVVALSVAVTAKGPDGGHAFDVERLVRREHSGQALE